jgi:uncharacterized protein (DUF4415 family)
MIFVYKRRYVKPLRLLLSFRKMNVGARKYAMNTLPTLTEADRARLKALAAKPDSEIDTSEIPEWPDAQWKDAVRGKFYRPNKKQITAKVDADVLD